MHVPGPEPDDREPATGAATARDGDGRVSRHPFGDDQTRVVARGQQRGGLGHARRPDRIAHGVARRRHRHAFERGRAEHAHRQAEGDDPRLVRFQIDGRDLGDRRAGQPARRQRVLEQGVDLVGRRAAGRANARDQ